MKIDFASARKSARDLRGLADDCAAAGLAVKRRADGVSQFWEGAAAVAFSQGMGRWKTEMGRIEKDMDALARLIGKAADEFERKEKEAAAKAAAMAAAATAKSALIKSSGLWDKAVNK